MAPPDCEHTFVSSKRVYAAAPTVPVIGQAEVAISP
jgi:hypothetical protein